MYQYNNFGYGYQPQPVQRQYSQPRFKCVPVSSMDEARNAMIDFDGSINVFVDVINKNIYTKQINEAGILEFKSYVEAIPKAPANPLEERVSMLEAELNEIKGGLNNAANNAINADGTEQPKSNGATSATKRK